MGQAQAAVASELSSFRAPAADGTRGIACDWSPPYRHDRIRERMEAMKAAGHKLTLDDFRQLQQDSTSTAALYAVLGLVSRCLSCFLSRRIRKER